MTEQGRSTVVVDGSNVAFEEPAADGKPQVKNLLLAMDTLRQQYRQVIVIIDAALHHQIDDPQKMEQLLDEQVIHQSPADASADYFVLQTAAQTHADVLTNDTYRNYQHEFPWIEHRRIPYMIINGRFIIYRPAQAESRAEYQETLGT